MYRLAYEELLKWKNNRDRKPLIIDGMRQCGKTYLLKEFGKKNYENVVYLNFEDKKELIDIFEPNLDTNRILVELGVAFHTKIKPEDTLVIFDEIQYCSRALTSLKYFCENAPEYHIACAGSLLGVLMSKPYSYPVGKVDMLKMWPLTFKEFLLANGEDMLVEKMDELVPPDNFIIPFSVRLEHYLNLYLTIGGMPGVVKSWIEEKDIRKVDRILNDIISAYKMDFSNHASKNVEKLTLIWNSISEQVVRENKKFMFGHVKAGARAKDLEDALQWLINAGLIYKVKLADPSRLPLKMFADGTFFKLYFADVGIFRVMSGFTSFFDPNIENIDLFKGAIVENYVLCELVATSDGVPFFWRSKRNAEIDFLVQHENKPIPIEVKSGYRTASPSMKEYISQFKPDIMIMTSLDIGESDLVKRIPLWWFWRYKVAIKSTSKKFE